MVASDQPRFLRFDSQNLIEEADDERGDRDEAEDDHQQIWHDFHFLLQRRAELTDQQERNDDSKNRPGCHASRDQKR